MLEGLCLGWKGDCLDGRRRFRLWHSAYSKLPSFEESTALVLGLGQPGVFGVDRTEFR